MPRNPLFHVDKPVIAMIHLDALPGTPAHHLSPDAIVERALAEAEVYRAAGVHGLMIENMHDTPYTRNGVGPEIVATMTVVGRRIKDAVPLPCGIQILAAANIEALAVAHAAGLDFIRAEGFAFAHVADEGLIQSSAADVLRHRKRIGADRVQVWADIKKKHCSHAITADLDLDHLAAAVEFLRGDAIIVTGFVTGRPPGTSEVRLAGKNRHVPLYLGSGITHRNLPRFYPLADGFIVGSEFKRRGHWSEPIDPDRVARFMSTYSRFTIS